MPKRKHEGYTSTTVSLPSGKKAKLQVPRSLAGKIRVGGTGTMKSRMNATELKYIDKTCATETVSTSMAVPAFGSGTNFIGALVAIPQGTSDQNRIGKRVIVKSIAAKINFTFSPPNTTTPQSSSTVKIFLVQDTQHNGSGTCSNSAVFTGTDANLAFPNVENQQRYKVLWQKQIQLGAGTTNFWNGASISVPIINKQISFYKKCSIPVDFDTTATDGNLTTIRSNNLYFIVGREAAPGFGIVQMNGVARTRFVDP